MDLLDENMLRIALAAQAYRANIVRLVEPDLSGCSHLVATRHGLFATDGQALRCVAHGFFYGITMLDDAILAFEAGDRPRARTGHGRIVRFRHQGGRIIATDILATGLDNGCHQIDVIDDRLCVIDTYNQRVLRFATGMGEIGGSEPEILHPLPPAALNDWAGGYAHVNSLIAHGEDILLLLHNGAGKTGRPSEIARFDRDWRLIERVSVDGQGCHSLAILEDGAVLTCGSLGGELVTTDGRKIAVSDMMTRGLSVSDDGVVVGGSAFAERDARDAAHGALFFLDRDYRPRTRISVPAPVMEIRRIDGRDRSLSGFVAAAGPVASNHAGRSIVAAPRALDHGPGSTAGGA